MRPIVRCYGGFGARDAFSRLTLVLMIVIEAARAIEPVNGYADCRFAACSILRARSY